MPYTLIDVGGRTGGGMTVCHKGQAPRWLAYVGVDDIEAATRKAREPGATVLQDVTGVGDCGRIA